MVTPGSVGATPEGARYPKGVIHCNRGQEIAAEPGPLGHWYYVIVGAVRRSAVRSDGRRQIVDLMLGEETRRKFRRGDEVAGKRLQASGKQFRKCRFAVAICTQEADAVVVGNRQIEPRENRLFLIRQAVVIELRGFTIAAWVQTKAGVIEFEQRP